MYKSIKIFIFIILFIKNFNISYSGIHEYQIKSFKRRFLFISLDNKCYKLYQHFSDNYDREFNPDATIPFDRNFFPRYNWKNFFDYNEPEGIYLKHTLDKEFHFMGINDFIPHCRNLPIIYDKDSNDIPTFSINFSHIYQPINFTLVLGDDKNNVWVSKEIFVDKTESEEFNGPLNKYYGIYLKDDERNNEKIMLMFEKVFSKSILNFINNNPHLEKSHEKKKTGITFKDMINKMINDRLIKMLLNDKKLDYNSPSQSYIEEQAKQELIKIKQELGFGLGIGGDAQTKESVSKAMTKTYKSSKKIFDPNSREFNINPFDPKWCRENQPRCSIDFECLKTFEFYFYPCDPTQEKVLFELGSIGVVDGEKLGETKFNRVPLGSPNCETQQTDQVPDKSPSQQEKDDFWEDYTKSSFPTRDPDPFEEPMSSAYQALPDSVVDLIVKDVSGCLSCSLYERENVTPEPCSIFITTMGYITLKQKQKQKQM